MAPPRCPRERGTRSGERAPTGASVRTTYGQRGPALIPQAITTDRVSKVETRVYSGLLGCGVVLFARRHGLVGHALPTEASAPAGGRGRDSAIPRSPEGAAHGPSGASGGAFAQYTYNELEEM